MFKQAIVAAAAAAMFGAFGAAQAQHKSGETKLEHAAHRTAEVTRKAARKTADATRSATRKTVKATRNAAQKTSNATRRAVNRVKHDDRARHEDRDFRAGTTREQRINEAHANWQRERRL